MSTDSTELTFVRCPSCRSLVPAISTRCRMCGATLEATAAAEGGDQEPRKSGRVRQRTMSETSSEMSTAVGQVREAPVVQTLKAAPAIAASPQSVSADLGDDDPLSDYFEEDDLKEEEEPVLEDSPPTMAATTRSTPPLFDDENETGSDDQGDDDDVDLDAEDPLAAFTKPAIQPESPKAPPAPAPAAPRVVVESGARKGEKPSQLNFGGQKQSTSSESAMQGEQPKAHTPAPRALNTEPRRVQEARPAQPPQQTNRQPQRDPGQQQNRPTQQQSAPPKQTQPPAAAPGNGAARVTGGAERQQQGAERRAQPSTPPPPPPREEPRQQQTARVESRPEQSPLQRQVREEAPDQSVATRATQLNKSQPATTLQAGAAKSPAQTGRLFGWLVNYSDPNGTALEIREGKFFVTNKSVKANDLVLDDPTISAPHALLNVSAAGGLFVQDLMSERGVHVRRKGSDTYRREEETVSLTHGDWVRFGDLEFLISLIAYPGER